VQPIRFSYAISDFDLDLLPVDPEVIKNNPSLLREAIKAYYQSLFKRAGGELTVTTDGDEVSVTWVPASSDEPGKLFDCAVTLLEQGAYQEAERILHPLQEQFPDNPGILYNLGMMLSDQGRLAEAIPLLSLLTQLQPDHANGWIALGVALQRKGDTARARQALEKSVALEPDNPYALRNLGALIANEDPIAALPHLKKAVELLPGDQNALYGYGLALVESGDISEGDSWLKKAMELAPYSEIAERCRTKRNEIANHGFRKGAGGGLRMDAVMYCLSALKKYSEMGPEAAQTVTFEIAMLGRGGLDSSDPDPKYHLKSLQGSFTGLQLVCMMYVGFKAIAPDQDMGFDLSKEYEAAKSMLEKEL
jgi:Flp pilus assembly protein TadD